MDLRHQLALCKAQVQLVEDLDVVLATDYLKANNILSTEDAEQVLAKQTYYGKRRCLLDILPRKGPKAFEKFDDFLQTDQPWLHESLQRKFSEVTQEVLGKARTSFPRPCGGVDRRSEFISKARQDLMKDLAVDSAVDYLISELVLTREEAHWVRTRDSDFEKRDRLLNILPQKGPAGLDGLCCFLGDKQPWLYGRVQRCLDETEQDKTVFFTELSTPAGGPTRSQLQDALRRNLNRYIDNDPSKILPKSETGPYLTQPVNAVKVTERHETEQLGVTDIFDLIETCSNSERIFVLGTAGMGKSTLCRQLAKSWVEGDRLTDKFTFIFPIPLRLVRSRSFVDIICDDLQLLPSSCKERVRQEIDLDPSRCLIVLDSYEELSHAGEGEEIVRLIKRDVLEETMVLVTARPSQQIKQLEEGIPGHIHTELLDLAPEQIEHFIGQFPKLDANIHDSLVTKFGSTFLRRPINLWLMCYVAVTTGLGLGLPVSQTMLLNVIIQLLLLPYLKKKNLPEFKLTNGSPLTSPDLPFEVKSILKEAGKLCYSAVKANTHVMKITEGILSKEDLLALGLFADGPEVNSVVLPHQLFKEYLAALYLSAEEKARDEFIGQIQHISLAHSPRPCLVDILRCFGFDNVVRFLVGLMPSTARELTEMFVIKQGQVRIVRNVAGPGILHEKAEYFRFRYSCMHFELDLLRECYDGEMQTLIARALLHADIVAEDKPVDLVVHHSTHHLLNFYTPEEMKVFLKRYYNCQVLNANGQHVVSLFKEGDVFLFDTFVAGFIILHNCRIQMEVLWFRHARLPVQVIAHMTNVDQFIISQSTLYKDIPECAVSLGLRVRQGVSVPVTSQSTVHSFSATNVRGLKLLTSRYVLSATNNLVLQLRDVTLAEVSRTFPLVQYLRLWYHDNAFFDDPKPRPSVRRLALGCSSNIDVTKLREAFPRLEHLEVTTTTIITDDRQTAWKSLRGIKLVRSHVKRQNTSLNQKEAEQTLARMFPNAAIVVEGYQDEEEASQRDKYRKAYEQAIREDRCCTDTRLKGNWDLPGTK